METNTPRLSPAATSALSRMGTSALGTPITKGGPVPTGVLAELKDTQLITPTGNLTRRGSIVRERLVNALLDAAFAL